MPQYSFPNWALATPARLGWHHNRRPPYPRFAAGSQAETGWGSRSHPGSDPPNPSLEPSSSMGAAPGAGASPCPGTREGHVCSLSPSTGSSRCRGGIRSHGQHGCALVFQGKIWRGKQSCCVSKYSICADWQSSHPWPQASPSQSEPYPALPARRHLPQRRETRPGQEGARSTGEMVRDGSPRLWAGI